MSEDEATREGKYPGTYVNPGVPPQDPTQEEADIAKRVEPHFTEPPTVDDLSDANQVSAAASMTMGTEKDEETPGGEAADEPLSVANIRDNDLAGGDPEKPQKEVSDAEVKQRLAEVADTLQVPEAAHVRVTVLPPNYSGTAVDSEDKETRLSPGDVEIYDGHTKLVHRTVWEDWKERLRKLISGS